jgi:predicted NUDIX family NTP pyrophosphohydrolase
LARAYSSGTLLYRTGVTGGLEVLLVHPSGNYNRGKPWSIPKGNPEVGESDQEAARRETREETGVAAGPLVSLGSIVYRKSGKRIVCFAGPAPTDSEPRCASWEVDRAEFVPLPEAWDLLHPDQREFLRMLREMLH